VVGQKRPEANKGLSTRQGADNFTLPFTTQRPAVVSEDNSGTTVVEYNAGIVLTGNAANFTLGNGAYVGARVDLLNLRATESRLLQNTANPQLVCAVPPASRLTLYWNGNGWADTIWDQKNLMEWYDNNLTSLYNKVFPAGFIINTAIPTKTNRLQNRLLDLDGSTVDITGEYARMAANVYCGDSINSTAEAYYKCTNPGNPSGSRSPTGMYMKLPAVLPIKDVVPDYANQTPSKISTSGGTWTVDADGFVRVGAIANGSNTYGSYSINGVNVKMFMASTVNSQEYSIYQVKKGDTVSVSGIGNGSVCYYIPPRNILWPNQTVCITF
jgi:hypothetical protein